MCEVKIIEAEKKEFVIPPLCMKCEFVNIDCTESIMNVASNTNTCEGFYNKIINGTMAIDFVKLFLKHVKEELKLDEPIISTRMLERCICHVNSMFDVSISKNKNTSTVKVDNVTNVVPVNEITKLNESVIVQAIDPRVNIKASSKAKQGFCCNCIHGQVCRFTKFSKDGIAVNELCDYYVELIQTVTHGEHGHNGFYKVIQEMAQLHAKKSKDYATKDNPLGNFERTGVLMSSLLNANNKRLGALLSFMAKHVDSVYEIVSNSKCVVNENLRSRFMDIAVYCVLAIVMLDDDKKKN